jgi:Flp pilus assembly protein TadB
MTAPCFCPKKTIMNLGSANPQSEIQNTQSAVTDSPWFWVLVFSSMGLLALAVIGFSGKYGKRQSIIERQYQARQRIAEKLPAENNPKPEERINDMESRRPYATPGNNLIELWPLAALMGLAASFAAAMLYRARRASLGHKRIANSL